MNIYQFVQELGKRSRKLLELACGTGQLSYPLSSRVRLWEAKIRIMDTAAVFMSMGLIMVRQVLMGGGCAELLVGVSHPLLRLRRQNISDGGL